MGQAMALEHDGAGCAVARPQPLRVRHSRGPGIPTARGAAHGPAGMPTIFSRCSPLGSPGPGAELLGDGKVDCGVVASAGGSCCLLGLEVGPCGAGAVAPEGVPSAAAALGLPSSEGGLDGGSKDNSMVHKVTCCCPSVTYTFIEG